MLQDQYKETNKRIYIYLYLIPSHHISTHHQILEPLYKNKYLLKTRKQKSVLTPPSHKSFHTKNKIVHPMGKEEQPKDAAAKVKDPNGNKTWHIP